MKPTIICEHCNGTGRTHLSRNLQETFDAIPARKPVTTDELKEALPEVAPTAQNNRLERLRELGLLTRFKSGRMWRYTREQVLSEHRTACRNGARMPKKKGTK